MDIDHYELSFISLFLEQVDDLLGVGGGQSGSGLVEKEDGGLADELQGYVEPFALASGDVFVDGRADFKVLGAF